MDNGCPDKSWSTGECKCPGGKWHDDDDCIHADLKIADIPDKGKGVLANVDFKREDVVGEYTGEIISAHEAKLREEQYLADYPKDMHYKAYLFFFSFRGSKLW